MSLFAGILSGLAGAKKKVPTAKQIIATMARRLGKPFMGEPAELGDAFLFPDGTLRPLPSYMAHESFTNATAQAAQWALGPKVDAIDLVLSAGIIRWKAATAIEVAAVPTWEQARVIAAAHAASSEYSAVRTALSFHIDVTWFGYDLNKEYTMRRNYIVFDTSVSASKIRETIAWVLGELEAQKDG